jgi:hypothetical protein
MVKGSECWGFFLGKRNDIQRRWGMEDEEDREKKNKNERKVDFIIN